MVFRKVKKMQGLFGRFRSFFSRYCKSDALPNHIYHKEKLHQSLALTLRALATPTVGADGMVRLLLPNSADLTACMRLRGRRLLHITYRPAKYQYHQINHQSLCPDDACGGLADGWGERACAAALTVGLIFWFLFHLREKEQNEKLA